MNPNILKLFEFVPHPNLQETPNYFLKTYKKSKKITEVLL